MVHKRPSTKNLNPAKIEKTMSEFKHGDLRSGSKEGPKVTSRKQAEAIAISQARKEKKNK